MERLIFFTFVGISSIFVKNVGSSCTFPSSYRDHDWFKTWDAQDFADYWLIRFKASKFTWMPYGLNYNLDVDFTCFNTLQDDIYFYYTLEQLNFATKFCAVSIDGANSLANKYKTIDDPSLSGASQIDVATCQSELSVEDVTILPAYPFADITVPESCGLTDGSYQLSYTPPEGTAQCADDETSSATIAGDVITMTSCYDGQAAYTTPFNTELSCIDRYSEDLIGDGGGDIVVLADFTKSYVNETRFYCARINQAGSLLQLSLDLQDEHQIYCKYGVDYQTASDGYASLTLMKISDQFPDDATCDFPSAWGDLRWWISTSDLSNLAVPMFNSYSAEARSTELVFNGIPLHTVILPCYGSVVLSETSHIYVYLDNPVHYCVQESVYNNNIIFHKEVQSEVAYDTLTCPLEIQNEASYAVYLKSPLQDEFDAVTVPFSEGEYQTTYSESSLSQDNCAGNQGSTATVSGTTIVLDLCLNTDTYQRPYRSTLTAIASWSASELEADPSGGDFLLLVDNLPTDTNSFRMWCARYLIDGHKVYLSIDVTSSDSVTCNAAQDATYAADETNTRARAFVLTLEVEETTAVQTTATPATCDFQPLWTNATSWWVGSLDYQGVRAPFYRIYTETEVETSLISNDQALSSFTTPCTSFLMTSSEMVYFTSRSSSDYVCSMETVVQEKIIVRSEKTRSGTEYQATDCSAALADIDINRLFLKAPLDVYFTAERCPFSDGEYHVSYSESSGTRDRCANEASSMATVNDVTLTLDTCSNTNTFMRPYQSTLYCLASWSASLVGADPSQGDFVILASSTLPDEEEANTYCGRYKEIDGIIHLSIGVVSEVKLECDFSRDYSFYSNQDGREHRAFVFTPIPDVTTKSDDPTTLADSETTALSTMEPSTLKTTELVPDLTTKMTTVQQSTTDTEVTTPRRTTTQKVTTSRHLTTDGTMTTTPGEMTSHPTTYKTTHIGSTMEQEATTELTSSPPEEFTTAVTTEDGADNVDTTQGDLTTTEETSVRAEETTMYLGTTTGSQHHISTVEPSTVQGTTMDPPTTAMQDLTTRQERTSDTPEQTTKPLEVTTTPTSDIRSTAVTTAAAAVETTTAVDTTAPAVTTAASAETTTSPSTTAAETTTAAVVETTAAVVDTTVAPVPTTADTATTAAARDTTVAAVPTTTGPPGSTTVLPTTTEIRQDITHHTGDATAHVTTHTPTTAAPVATTHAAQQATTSAQQVTTAAQQVTTAAQQVTTAAQQTTTSAQQVTTAAQQVTTAAQHVTTAAQQVTTTPQQVTTTPQQVTTTPQQVTTAAEGPGVTTDAIVTTASSLNETAEHVTITADGDYDSVVTPDEEGFLDSVSSQVATTSGVSEDRITNIEASSGSIIIEFDLLPGGSSSPGYVAVENAIANLQQALDRGELRFTLTDGTVVEARALSRFSAPDGGPCSLSPCENGGECVDRTISLPQCTCTDAFSGRYCEVLTMALAQSGMANTSSYIIGICTAAGLIVVLTLASLIVCRARTRDAEKRPPPSSDSSEQGGFTTMPRSWTAGYRQFGSHTYGVDSETSYPTNTNANHTGIYTTILNVSDYHDSTYNPYSTFNA